MPTFFSQIKSNELIKSKMTKNKTPPLRGSGSVKNLNRKKIYKNQSSKNLAKMGNNFNRRSYDEHKISSFVYTKT